MKLTPSAEISPAVTSALESITREVAAIHNLIHSKAEKTRSQRNDILFAVSIPPLYFRIFDNKRAGKITDDLRE